jgi:hypothetical protein
MTTRFSGGIEERTILLQYAIEQARNSVDELTEKLTNMHSLGRFTEQEFENLKKSLSLIKESIEKY